MSAACAAPVLGSGSAGEPQMVVVVGLPIAVSRRISQTLKQVLPAAGVVEDPLTLLLDGLSRGHGLPQERRL